MKPPASPVSYFGVGETDASVAVIPSSPSGDERFAAAFGFASTGGCSLLLRASAKPLKPCGSLGMWNTLPITVPMTEPTVNHFSKYSYLDY